MKDAKLTLYRLISEKKITPKDAALILKELDGEKCVKKVDIAVIGVAGKMPDADNLDEYWGNLRNGKKCIREIPADRKDDIERILPENAEPHVFGKAGYLKNIDRFDSSFFRISPKEAKYMEPEQRLLLETAWQAIEDAGYSERIYGTETGVYVGFDHISGSIYKKYSQGVENPDTLALTGVYPSILSSRISYILNLQGPSIVFDTACSSGLVAVHKACEALKNGECEMVIACGVALQLWPLKFQSFRMVETEDDAVRCFDKKSAGTVWGEGVGVVILKNLDQAIKDGDNIHAVIKGSAVNNDGISSGITAPNAESQENVIIKAWENAGIEPESVSYIETHGTGTVLGDPVEIKALKNAFSRFTNKKQFCGIGSLKPAIGHLVGASGLASLLKVILSMKNREIPPTINFEEPNPLINFADSPLYVNDSLRPWSTEGIPRRSGVSCFGFSGTNCHMIVEEAPERKNEADVDRNGLHVMVLSAKSAVVLRKLAALYCDYLGKKGSVSLRDICYTASIGRCHYDYRIAMTVTDTSDLIKKMYNVSVCDFAECGETGFFYGFGDKSVSNPDRRFDSQNGINLLCERYVSGSSIEWLTELYDGKKGNIVSLPSYPFEGARVWCFPESVEKYRNETRESREVGGSFGLLGCLISETAVNTTYVNRLSSDSNWELGDHRIMGNCVLPGTALLDMALQACRIYFGSDAEMRDIYFPRSFAVEPGLTKEIYTTLRKEDDHVSFVICGKAGDNWEIYAEGRAYAAIEEKFGKSDYRLSDNEQTEVISGHDLKTNIKGASFGHRWNNITEVRRENGEIYILLEELGKQIAEDSRAIHPSLLDNAVNIHIRLEGDKKIRLPFSYGNVDIRGDLPYRFTSRVFNIRQGNSGSKITTMDIDLAGENGEVFGRIRDYSTIEIQADRMLEGKRNNLFSIAWKERLEVLSGAGAIGGATVLLVNRSGRSGAIADELRKNGHKVIAVSAGKEFVKEGDSDYVIEESANGYERLFSECKDLGITHVIHASSLDMPDTINDLVSLKKNVENGVLSVFRLAKTLSGINFHEPIRFMLLSDYAYPVVVGQKTIKAHNASLLGMGKVISLENENLMVKCLDIDDEFMSNQILPEMFYEENYSQIAYRSGQRYSEEFVRLEADGNGESVSWVKRNGTYLVTGGNGGIGIELCRHISEKEPVNLCIVSRSEIPDRKDWERVMREEPNGKIRRTIEAAIEIEKGGSRVSFYMADASDMNAMEKVFSDIRKNYGSLQGVFHCAGVAGEGLVMRKKESSFMNVLSPKVFGTWILDRLTEKDNLEVFVCFSSIFSVFGGFGQADYCAANCYLDSFTAFRNAEGRKTISINWPGWKEIGMAAEHGLTESSGVFMPISKEEAFFFLDKLIQNGTSNSIVGDFDFGFLSEFKSKIKLNFSEELERVISDGMKHGVTGKKPEKSGRGIISAEIVGKDGLPPSKLEKEIGLIWANLLENETVKVLDSFYDLGGDSILATQLTREINNAYKNVLTPTDIFNYPTVADLAAYIKSVLNNRGGENNVLEDEYDDKLNTILDKIDEGDADGNNLIDMLSDLRGE